MFGREATVKSDAAIDAGAMLVSFGSDVSGESRTRQPNR